MNNKIPYTFLVSCLFLFSCSNHQFITKRIAINTPAVDLFSKSILNRFTDYADTSRNYLDSDNFMGKKGCVTIIGMSINNKKVDKHNIVLYTFDGRDSCILYSDTLQVGKYELSFYSISVPEGYYYIKHEKDTIYYFSPPNQVLW
jgi:hypothetical protein